MNGQTPDVSVFQGGGNGESDRTLLSSLAAKRRREMQWQLVRKVGSRD